jgi:type III secretion protein L
MVVWLGVGRLEASFEHGVIPREDLAPLGSMVEAAAAAQREIEVMLSMAKVQARQMVTAAAAESEKILQEARQLRDNGFSRGYEHGVRQASEDWAAEAIHHAVSDRTALERKSQRMAQLVTDAVQRIVETEDTQALYRRALRTVIKQVGDVPILTLRVSEGEQDAARRAIDTILAQLNCRTPIDVVGDIGVRVGACMFESDQGSIDASLDVQLDAIRRAVGRAARRAATMDGANAPSMHDDEDDVDDDADDEDAVNAYDDDTPQSDLAA